MQPLRPQPTLADQVYERIADLICDGELPAGAHLVQEQLAEQLGVSRQPVQQAMALLKADGMVREIGRRGLAVTPLDLDMMVHHYEIRASLDGLAARLAATRTGDMREALSREGRAILARGNAAVEARDVAEQVRQDLALHTLIYEASGNPFLGKTAEPHWRFLRRAMADVLRYAEPPREVWQQHEAILKAIVAGDPARAEALSVEHARGAAERLLEALKKSGKEAR